MRIIGGKYRGRRFEIAGFKARPTTDFAKEALFNIIENRYDLEDCSVLDLFAGTGGISLEFVSRGAKCVHLVEKDKAHILGIRSIIKTLGCDNIKTIHIDMKTYLKVCDTQYDIVFADPPYDLSWFDEVPDMILSAGVIAADGIFILEHPKTMDFSQHPNFFEHRNYGGVNFSFFK